MVSSEGHYWRKRAAFQWSAFGWYKISFGTEIFLKILNSNSSLSWCCLSKIVCILTKLLSVRELGFAVWLREVCTFHRQCLLQISYDIKLPCSSPTMACPVERIIKVKFP